MLMDFFRMKLSSFKLDPRHPGHLTVWVLVFPLIILLIYSDGFREADIYSRIGWYFLLLSLAYLTCNKVIYLLLLLPFFLAGMLDLMYTLTFSQQFESPVFRVIADTNQEEASEFLSNYFNLLSFAALILYSLVLFFLARKMELARPHSRKAKILVVIGLLMLVMAVRQLVYYERYRDILPGALGQVVDGAVRYAQVEEEMLRRPQLLAAFPGKVTRLETERPKVFVVVIGESAARKHHSLYGYHRDTNPQLRQIQNELLVFDQVTSPYAVTYLSLSQTLSQATRENGMGFSESLSLVGLAKKAGYQTWWISSQSKFEGTTLSLSAVADHSVFLTGYDGDLLPFVKQALESSHEDKVIFVHIRGSHMIYSRRYPVDFDFFKAADDIQLYTKTPSQEQIEVANAYDNSIRYTDYFLNEVIGLLRPLESINGLVYFADHGEEVYDYENFIGHELKRTTPVMFEIPFLVWLDDAYKESFGEKYRNMVANRQQPFLNENFFDFGLCVLGIDVDLNTRTVTPCDSSDYHAKSDASKR